MEQDQGQDQGERQGQDQGERQGQDQGERQGQEQGERQGQEQGRAADVPKMKLTEMQKNYIRRVCRLGQKLEEFHIQWKKMIILDNLHKIQQLCKISHFQFTRDQASLFILFIMQSMCRLILTNGKLAEAMLQGNEVAILCFYECDCIEKYLKSRGGVVLISLVAAVRVK